MEGVKGPQDARVGGTHKAPLRMSTYVEAAATERAGCQVTLSALLCTPHLGGTKTGLWDSLGGSAGLNLDTKSKC